jgi:hypothetical protein
MACSRFFPAVDICWLSGRYPQVAQRASRPREVIPPSPLVEAGGGEKRVVFAFTTHPKPCLSFGGLARSRSTRVLVSGASVACKGQWRRRWLAPIMRVAPQWGEHPLAMHALHG